MIKNPPGSVPGLGRSPGGGHGTLLRYSCLENPYRQRSLVGYSPWDHKESDMTGQLLFLVFSFIQSINKNLNWTLDLGMMERGWVST